MIVTVDHSITSYACSTDTGAYVYSQFYIASSGMGMHFVDCYYNVNEVLNFIIGFGFICCCFCCRLCARGATSDMCKPIFYLLAGAYYLLCWCPTSSNM